MRKLISLLLALVLCAGLAVPALAADDTCTGDMNNFLPELAISDAEAANSYITREVMAYLYAMALPVEELPAINTILSIPDMDDSNNYTGYVLHLYNAGVLVGSDAFGVFKPDTPIIRAEAAAILARVALPEMRLQNMPVEHWSFPQWHEKSTIAVERDAEHEVNDSGHHIFTGVNSLVYVTLTDVENQSITELDTNTLAQMYFDSYDLAEGVPVGYHDLMFGDTAARAVTFTWNLNGYAVPSTLLFVIADGVFMTAQYSFIAFPGEEEHGMQMVERMVNNTGITGYALNKPLVFTR